MEVDELSDVWNGKSYGKYETYGKSSINLLLLRFDPANFWVVSAQTIQSLGMNFRPTINGNSKMERR